ncbi:glutathione peroxidase [Flavobacteriaceae bacterium UJ101]|nr:glutathione peroxidase [Flavobacteriaceae bacterium UJ101]
MIENQYQMNKILTLLIICSIIFSCKKNNTPVSNNSSSKITQTQPSSFYDLKTNDIHDTLFSFDLLKGKKVLIVNTASKCGYTKQYAALQKLYDQYKDHNFIIIGFPSNNFGGQEPGSNLEIQQFCQENYGVTFPMMTKIDVKGSNKNLVYKWLTNRKLNGKADVEVNWNFNKFFIDENGEWIQYFPSNVTPFAPEIIKLIES